MTGNLPDTQIIKILELQEELSKLEARKQSILQLLEKTQQLTPELKKAIEKSQTLSLLEEIYAPYKSQRKTKAMKAKEAGLGPLVDLLFQTKTPLEESIFTPFQTQDYPSKEDLLKGVMDIFQEQVSLNLDLRHFLFLFLQEKSLLVSHENKNRPSETSQEEALKYKDYFDYRESFYSLSLPKNGHRFLAMRRGSMQKILLLSFEWNWKEQLSFLEKKFLSSLSFTQHPYGKLYEKTFLKALEINLIPSLELEGHALLKQKADQAAIEIFEKNLKDLLLAPYFGAKTVLGIDPGIRTGHKYAVVSKTGVPLQTGVLFLHPSLNQQEKELEKLSLLCSQHKIEAVCIGNGTFGQETFQLVRPFLLKVFPNLPIVSISESGASIYSTSSLAQEEFPERDPTERSAISLARRFQDPLAELIKIDPKSIGVGQYQHDVNQSKLKKSLNTCVEFCVNLVGVDVNTASAPLLSYISGIGPSLAKNIVETRQKKGGLRSRQELLEISRFGGKQLEQAGGFLRIFQGTEFLDSTFVHPECYDLIHNWCQNNQTTPKELSQSQALLKKFREDFLKNNSLGHFALEELIKALTAPKQDPREEFSPVSFDVDLKGPEDLKEKKWYYGVINNITAFGAFVNLGIKENGLLHLSESKEKLENLKVGQEIKVRVLNVDKERKRISLSTKLLCFFFLLASLKGYSNSNSKLYSKAEKDYEKKIQTFDLLAKECLKNKKSTLEDVEILMGDNDFILYHQRYIKAKTNLAEQAPQLGQQIVLKTPNSLLAFEILHLMSQKSYFDLMVFLERPVTSFFTPPSSCSKNLQYPNFKLLHLFNHSSGLTSPLPNVTSEDFQNFLSSCPRFSFAFKPGTQYLYNSNALELGLFFLQNEKELQKTKNTQWNFLFSSPNFFWSNSTLSLSIFSLKEVLQLLLEEESSPFFLEKDNFLLLDNSEQFKLGFSQFKQLGLNSLGVEELEENSYILWAANPYRNLFLIAVFKGELKNKKPTCLSSLLNSLSSF